jgi:hypothetical protein
MIILIKSEELRIIPCEKITLRTVHIVYSNPHKVYFLKTGDPMNFGVMIRSLGWIHGE